MTARQAVSKHSFFHRPYSHLQTLTLKSVIQGLEETLCNEYTKPKCSILAQKVRDGILPTNFDWYNAPQPSSKRFDFLPMPLHRLCIPAIRPYVYDIMNYLVELHAQVWTVSESLLERMLNAVLGELVDEAIKCFSQVNHFGTGGLLTVRRFFFFLFGNRSETLLRLLWSYRLYRNLSAITGEKQRQEKCLRTCTRNGLQMHMRHQKRTRSSRRPFKPCKRICLTRGKLPLYSFCVLDKTVQSLKVTL